MKILFVITQSGWGGAQRYVFDLAANLDGEKFSAAVAAGSDPNGELLRRLEGIGIRTIFLPTLKRSFSPFANLKFMAELRRLIAAEKPDVVHFNSTNAGIFGPIAAKLISPVSPPPKIIYTAHGFPFNEPGIVKKLLYVPLEFFAGFFRDKIICVSEADRRSALKYRIAPPEKLTVIHNGIDPNFPFLSKEEARRQLGIPQDNRLLAGAVVNFYPNKGLGYLIAAATLVLKKHPNVRFALVGDGPEKAAIEAKIRDLKIWNEFPLFPYRENGGRFLPAFDVVVSSSVKEGLPYLLLETGIAGLPTVATNVGGCGEIIKDGETGFLVPPKNPRKLAEAIETLIGDEKLRGQMGENAKNRAEKEFNLERMIRETE
ncbi:MAG: glycosyltransferase family 4 protein [Parcubacteria group bacterium]|nr:glycosyltransferase family 4 protein [Parcubacteria group bacterium]